jgi:hypothetical protein
VNRTTSPGSDLAEGGSSLDPAGWQTARAAAWSNETAEGLSTAPIRGLNNRRDLTRLTEQGGFPQSLDDNPTAERCQNLFPKKRLDDRALAWLWGRVASSHQRSGSGVFFDLPACRFTRSSMLFGRTNLMGVRLGSPLLLALSPGNISPSFPNSQSHHPIEPQWSLG